MERQTRTPEEMACGLECIRTNAERVCVKPEKGQCPRCEQIVGEANERIQQLEASYQQVSKALCGKENATLEEVLQAVSQVKAELAAVKRERDAAVDGLRGDCRQCIYFHLTVVEEPCKSCVQSENYVHEKWQWRGVCPETEVQEDD